MNKKELDLILQEGEGQFIEFKESFDKSLAKELVAFANASGGRIFLGINDKNKVVGLNITNKLKSQVQDMAKNCDPSIALSVGQVDNVLFIDIKEGQDKPYSCKEGFHMRMGSNSQKMKRNELVDLIFKVGRIKCQNSTSVFH